MGDAFAALHEMYYSGGASGYEEIDTDGGGWVNKFWGNRSGNISYVLNHSWVNGPKTEIEGNDKLAVYAYKDLVQYSDLYTWFEEDSYNASVGTEKVFTVHGINVMNSSENRDSAATPVNAAVTVYDEDGRVVDVYKRQRYRRGLAYLDRFLAERCDCVVEICLGRPVAHKGRLPALEGKT